MSPSGKTGLPEVDGCADEVSSGQKSGHGGSHEDDMDYEETIGNSQAMATSSEAFSRATGEPAAFLEQLEQFAAHFKQKRIQLGFTQADVGLAMWRLYGNDFSQTTISRFEALNLSFKNMCKLKPLLEKWLNDAEAAVANGTFNREILRSQPQPTDELNCASVGMRRRKRTSIEANLRHVLEEVFLTNPRPSPETLVEVASTLDMNRDIVRVWFCNRRQKERRHNPSVVFPPEPPGAVERFKAAVEASGLLCSLSSSCSSSKLPSEPAAPIASDLPQEKPPSSKPSAPTPPQPPPLLHAPTTSVSPSPPASEASLPGRRVNGEQITSASMPQLQLPAKLTPLPMPFLSLRPPPKLKRGVKSAPIKSAAVPSDARTERFVEIIDQVIERIRRDISTDETVVKNEDTHSNGSVDSSVSHCLKIDMDDVNESPEDP